MRGLQLNEGVKLGVVLMLRKVAFVVDAIVVVEFERWS